jgi:hypothetical protein
MYTYHCHTTKHVHVPQSHYKTCVRTTVTLQNMYTHHCHTTKHVHIPHSHTTKHVHVPLSQYKTCRHTTVTLQNMYTYTSHNIKRVPLGSANINAYFQDAFLLGYFDVWEVWQQRCGNLKFHSCYFSDLMQWGDRGECVCAFEQWNSILVSLYKYFSVYFNTFRTILKVHLVCLNFNYW